MKPKAIIAAIVAVLITFGTQLATVQDVSWRTVLAALVAAVAAHQSVYWTPYLPPSQRNGMVADK